LFPEIGWFHFLVATAENGNLSAFLGQLTGKSLHNGCFSGTPYGQVPYRNNLATQGEFAEKPFFVEKVAKLDQAVKLVGKEPQKNKKSPDTPALEVFRFIVLDNLYQEIFEIFKTVGFQFTLPQLALK
jgi:hypothetical protein